jgi:spoIIIJ-associated protein
MEWIEQAGRTVAEATERALDQLGIDESDAEIVVVEEGRPGIFGIGRTDARVRVRVRPATPRPKRTQRNRRQRPARENGPRQSDGDRTSAERDASTPPSAMPPADDEPGGSAAGAARSGNRRRRGGSRPRQGSESTSGASSATSTAREEEMTVEQQAEVARDFVAGVVERFGMTAEVGTRIEEDQILVEVTGTDLGLLVGQRGATLDALQELTRTVVQRRSDEHTNRLSVDVAGFREKRTRALENFARQVAQGVVESGEPHALEPMSAADRKVVHDTVNAISGVVTTSEGLEPRRYVVIRPAGADAD